VLRKLDLMPALRRFVGDRPCPAQGDPTDLHRHRSFITVNLFGGWRPLALPVHLVVAGPVRWYRGPDRLAAPAPIALAVSHTGLELVTCCSPDDGVLVG
jgi:cell cycle sensor histidine kinase DivJ